MIICRAHEAEYSTTPGGSLHFGPVVSALCHLSNIWRDFTAETPGCSLRPSNMQSLASSQVSRKNSMGSLSLTANVFEKIHLCYKSAWLCWNYLKLHPQLIWAIIWFYKLYQDSTFLKLNQIISLFCTLLLTEGSHTAKFTFHLFLCNNPLGLLRNTRFLMQCQHLLPFTLSLQTTQHESQMLQHAGVLDPLECEEKIIEGNKLMQI